MRGLVLLLLSFPALACNPAGDRWTSDDKFAHFGAGFVISAAVGTHTRDPWLGFLAGAGVNLLGELLDKPSGGVCSRKDALVGALGAAVGAGASTWFIRVAPDGAAVAYSRRF